MHEKEEISDDIFNMLVNDRALYSADQVEKAFKDIGFTNLTVIGSKRPLRADNLFGTPILPTKKLKSSPLAVSDDSADSDSDSNTIVKASPIVTITLQGERLDSDDWWKKLLSLAKQDADALFSVYKFHTDLSEPKLDHNGQVMFVGGKLNVRVKGKSAERATKEGGFVEWRYKPLELWGVLRIPPITLEHGSFSYLTATRSVSNNLLPCKSEDLPRKNVASLKSALLHCKEAFTPVHYEKVVNHFFGMKICQMRDTNFKLNATKTLKTKILQGIASMKKGNGFTSSSIVPTAINLGANGIMSGGGTTVAGEEGDTAELVAGSLSSKRLVKNHAIKNTVTTIVISRIFNKDMLVNVAPEGILQLATNRWGTRAVKVGNLLLAASKLPVKESIKPNVDRIWENYIISSDSFERKSILPSLCLGLIGKWIAEEPEVGSVDAVGGAEVDGPVDTSGTVIVSRNDISWTDNVTGRVFTNAQIWFMFCGFHGLVDVTFNQVANPGSGNFSYFSNAIFAMLIWAIGTDEADIVGLALKDATRHVDDQQVFKDLAKDKERLVGHLMGMDVNTKGLFWEATAGELILIVLRKWASVLNLPETEALESVESWKSILNKDCPIDFVERNQDFLVCIFLEHDLFTNIVKEPAQHIVMLLQMMRICMGVKETDETKGLNLIINTFWKSYFCRVYAAGTDAYFKPSIITKRGLQELVKASFAVVTIKDRKQLNGKIVPPHLIIDQGSKNGTMMEKFVSGETFNMGAKAKGTGKKGRSVMGTKAKGTGKKGRSTASGKKAKERKDDWDDSSVVSDSAVSSGAEPSDAESIHEWEAEAGGAEILGGGGAEIIIRQYPQRHGRRPSLIDP